MRLTFLGTGTSGGVPSIGCTCRVCRSSDPHDKRLRSSALLETDHARILIDCGPDFRQQIMPFEFKPFDGVLLTHIHYDHVSGIDDIRPFCVFGAVNIYADHTTVEGLKTTMPYCFADHLYPGVPLLSLHEIQPHQSFSIGDVTVMPIRVMHGHMPILGYRFGRLAYITDMKTIDEEEIAYLEGVEVLVVNALRFDKVHHSHQLVNDAVAFANRLGVQQTYLIHCTHQIGFHDEANARLPKNVRFAYDGQVIFL